MSVIRAASMAVCAFAGALSVPAWAQTYGSCTIAAASPDLGSITSFAAAQNPRQGSGSSGLGCSAISVATVSYLKVRLESSTFLMTGPGGRTIPFTVSSTPGGAAINAGAEVDFSSFDLLNLFTGPGGTVPLYFRTTPTAGLAAGTYTGTVSLRWHFSICSLGVAVCLAYSQSPGFVRPILFTPIDWGAGVPVTITVRLNIENDCMITAPDAEFGAAPLVSSFNPVTRTVSIRCSAGASYSVGLSNGENYSGGARRMRSGSNFLRYELYKGTSGADRWGSAGGERRASALADVNPGAYDGSTTQGFVYRAVIDPAQPTPPAGRYVDTILVDVAF
ncbi:MAG: hypothetical protein DI623_11285 [Sphingomonas sanxanigenens]|uniref:Spore coat protein U/FanG domain-containing protein n=1 Tax=Sphingomonas sanxanigenens TaxID=397260 RepID=A0A2W5A7E1_9SPHN|nr:MAG: hypothetical protein DI623_11285 [Sphingomonas sanxanigenens]